MSEISKTAITTREAGRLPARIKGILSAGILCLGMVATILWAVALAWAIPYFFL